MIETSREFPTSTPMLLLPLLAILSLFSFLPTSLSQPPPTPCNDGVLITYNHTTTERIAPFLPPENLSDQPYRFRSTLTVLNNGRQELKNWRVFVGFKNGELLVSAGSAVLADGEFLPANVSGGAVFSGSSVTDLKTAIGTAGDVDQMQAVVELLGTEFGVAPPNFSLPENITLANDGYSCLNPSTQGSFMSTCCTQSNTTKTNITFDTEFSDLQTGDLSIMYDVVMTYDINYLAQVTISNLNPLGRLDNWKLSWEWMEGEFIKSMRGSYPLLIDSAACIFGRQAQVHTDLDFSKVLNCDRRPTIVDLPLSKANDSALGLIPFCCRNGTILSPAMDAAASKSSFQIEVYKMPPELNKTELSPPLNWRINSSVGPEYRCAQPVRVAPSLFPEPSGLPSQTAAVASWQVVCNLTKTESSKKKSSCCVSFSSFFNDSVVPCSTCACGCAGAAGGTGTSCSATEPAVLLPAQALLVPFDNRTKMIREFADLKGRKLPDPMPCADNCGVSINWHVLSDFDKGWTARVTLLNWGDAAVVDWFAAVEMGKAMPGYEKVYSMDGRVLSNPDNDTLFLYGLAGLNYLVAETNGSNPRKDPPVPGSQQTVVSFTKKQTPGIRVAAGDGFPTRVYFNGEECSLPTMLPSDARRISGVFGSVLLLLLIFVVAAM